MSDEPEPLTKAEQAELLRLLNKSSREFQARLKRTTLGAVNNVIDSYRSGGRGPFAASVTDLGDLIVKMLYEHGRSPRDYTKYVIETLLIRAAEIATGGDEGIDLDFRSNGQMH